MPRAHPTPTTATIARWRTAGRGSGTGSTYQPWLTVHDVPSHGFSHRIDGWKTGRVHHFLSTWELAYFYYAEWSPIVMDIREQYPLFEVAETEALARQCGVRYPQHPTAHTPLVMTTDFLVTIRQQDQTSLLARTIKPRADLSKRTLEKFEIERRFWDARGVSWQIVTDQCQRQFTNDPDGQEN